MPALASNVSFLPATPSPFARWEDCTGVVGAFQTMRSTVAATVPGAFRVRGRTPETADVLFEAVHCARASTHRHVLVNVSYFHVILRVETVNESWSDGAASFFTLSRLTTDPALQGDLHDLGLEADLAQSSKETVHVADAVVNAWTFAGPASTVNLSYATQGSAAGAFRDDVLWWHASAGGFQRTHNQKAYAYDAITVQGGLVFGSGNWTTRMVLPTLGTPWAGQSYAFDEELWQADARVFEPEDPMVR